MGSVLVLLYFLTCGVLMARWWLPRLRPIVCCYIGASLGLLLLFWLPALLAYALRFTLTAHWLAMALMALLTLLSWLTRDRRAAVPFDGAEKDVLRAVLILCVPLTILAAWLQYTHSIRPVDGAYYVGQSTYGDLSLHLAVTTSIVNADFPLQNSLMLGATMAYPYLADSFATSMYMLGLPLSTAMALTGTVMMAFVFVGYTLLCAQLCRRRGAVFLAVCLLFLNGGLGFFYTLSGTVKDGVVTNAWENLRTVIEGYYKTPTNQPDPNNLRWSNIICDMLVPQRGILGGWTMLLPCLNLLVPPFARREKPDLRAVLLLGLFAGGLPLIHTHSFLALVLFSAGLCLYAVLREPKGGRFAAFKPFLLYAAIAAALALPQLICFTFVQATGSDHFLRFQFNWCNNRGGRGLVDPYFWFYIKNVGLPYVLILLALTQRRDGIDCSQRDWIGQWRGVAVGAFCIYVVAELVLFQPNEYDNNKLLYVWFMLCLPMAADYACLLYAKLKGVGGRRAIAALFLIVCFLSSTLTVARECVSSYQAYDAEDIAVGEWVRDETPEHCVFLTGNQHLNPVASLAGRTIPCGSDLYLYYHGFNTGERKAQLRNFYEAPAEHLDLLRLYGVEYIYVSPSERASYDVDEDALAALFEAVYRTESRTVYAVPAQYRAPPDDPAEDVNAIG